MDAFTAMALAAKAIELAQILVAENRAATAEEKAALWATADARDAAAVAADDAALK